MVPCKRVFVFENKMEKSRVPGFFCLSFYCNTLKKPQQIFIITKLHPEMMNGNYTVEFSRNIMKEAKNTEKG